MNAVILNGAEKDDAEMNDIFGLLEDELTRAGAVFKSISLHELDIHYCIGCFGCWIRTPGTCVIDDVGREVTRAIIQSDLTIFLTPVTFGGYSSRVKVVLDRSISLVMPYFKKIEGEIHHKPRYKRYPRFLGVGVLPQADAENNRIFTDLIGRNARNLHAPSHATKIILREQPAETTRVQIRMGLSAMEVRR